MGRPKAAKRKDIVPGIDLENGPKSNKITTFEENELEDREKEEEVEVEKLTKDNKKKDATKIREKEEKVGVKTRRSLKNEQQILDEEIIVEKVQRGRKKQEKVSKNVDENSDETKEIEKHEDEDVPEIVKADDNDILRLKQLHEEISMKPKTKKRKRDIPPKIETPEELDMSVLEAVEAYQEKREQLERLQEEEEESSEPIRDEPSRNRLTRKIGNITVSVLSGRTNMTSAYSTSKDAMKFLQDHNNAVPRVSYSAFAAKKIGGPSATFRVKA